MKNRLYVAVISAIVIFFIVFHWRNNDSTLNMLHFPSFNSFHSRAQFYSVNTRLLPTNSLSVKVKITPKRIINVEETPRFHSTPSIVMAPITNVKSLETFKEEILKSAFEIQKRNGFAFFMMFNDAFVPITKSWLCNVYKFEDVIVNTLFITTDIDAFNAMRDFSIDIPNLFLLPRVSLDLVYGQLSYYQYILFRLALINELLHKNIRVWLCESDAIWFENPRKYLNEFSEKDIVVQHDGLLDQNIPAGGFIFLNTTSRTKLMWEDLKIKMENALANLTEGFVDDKVGNEQLMLPKMFMKYHLHWIFFSRYKFVGGVWYTNKLFRENVQPAVIQNTWIKGSYAKMVRAIKWKHWFLNDSGEFCL